MDKVVKFTGREEELSKIDNIINDWGKRCIVFINAPGGYGKTRLIQEIRNRYKTGDALIITEIIDFDNRIFHLQENFGRKIAEMSDSKKFELYLKQLENFHKMEKAGISAEILQNTMVSSEHIFVECFNKISRQKRIVIFLDTTDALKDNTAIWDFLKRVEPQFMNTVILVAGRNARAIGENLESWLAQDISFIDLPPFHAQASKSYIEEKQELFNVFLEPDLAEKLLLLAGGRPILIDLAVEWRARNIPLKWLAEAGLEELQSLSDFQKQKHQVEFEKHLVKNIGEGKRQVDWLILVMSRVYPMDEDMIYAMRLAKTKESAKELFHEARGYIFVKRLPDGRICLHDEMRRMVNEHVWPDIDPYDERKIRDSKLAVNFFRTRIKDLTETFEEFEKKEDVSDEGDLHLIFMRRNAVQRELWEIKEQLLQHLLFTDLSEGVEYFIKTFDESTNSYHFGFRELLVYQILLYKDKLYPEQKYEVISRFVVHYLDKGRYEQAISLITDILENREISSENQIEMLIKRGNTEIRAGSIEKGISDFEKAVQISRDDNHDKKLVEALHARGWTYQLRGNLDPALKDYLEAFKLAVKHNDLRLASSLLNTMSYLNLQKGNYWSALNNSREALKLSEKNRILREKGRAYSLRGRIFELLDQLEESLNYYKMALNIFDEQNDPEWISIVRCNRSSVLIHQGKFEEAEKELHWVFDHCSDHIKVRIMFHQGNLYWKNKKPEHAGKKFEECRKFSRDIRDRFFERASYSTLIELTCELGEYDRYHEFDQEIQRMYPDTDDLSEMDFRLKGTSLRRIGDMAVCNGDYETALEKYKKGFVLIAKYEVLKRYTLGEQIRKTENMIYRHANTNDISKLGKDLSEFWNNETLLLKISPESLLKFQRWETEGDQNDQQNT
ncbi:MAG: AAA family ATPase [Desulfobacteraceae bacterium]|nr:AAA family ATPase [Desulfobacteraceae bacterium]